MLLHPVHSDSPLRSTRLCCSNVSVTQTANHIMGDLHEHLGQLIAYARMNRVVPPWSKQG
jgi:hypothetical protein